MTCLSKVGFSWMTSTKRLQKITSMVSSTVQINMRFLFYLPRLYHNLLSVRKWSRWEESRKQIRILKGSCLWGKPPRKIGTYLYTWLINKPFIYNNICKCAVLGINRIKLHSLELHHLIKRNIYLPCTLFGYSQDSEFESFSWWERNSVGSQKWLCSLIRQWNWWALILTAESYTCCRKL